MLLEESRHYEKGETWNQHLLWLLENRPQFLKRMFFKDRGKIRMRRRPHVIANPAGLSGFGE